MWDLRSKTLLMALVLAIGFGIGLTRLFLLRFEAGDVYPPYSSLRSDPLGTQVLYDGLNQMAEGNARRHFHPLDKIEFSADRTVLLCGLPAGIDWQMRSKAGERMMSNLESKGGRLILTFTATSRRLEQEDAFEDDPPEDGSSGKEDEPEREEDWDEPEDWRGLDELGMTIQRAAGEEPQARALRTAADPSTPLPRQLPWHGALFFDDLEERWDVLYTLDDNPVVIQRTWGRGTVVMVADTYLLSNEALRQDRRPDLLAWLIVPYHDVVFDESHLGLSRQPGIVGLALKYRLHGVIAVVLLIVVLLIWRQTAVFVPIPSADGKETAALPPTIGRDTAEGLVHLMRQHIAPEEVLSVCHKNWLHSAAVNHVPEEKMARVEEVLKDCQQTPRGHNPVEAYRQICQLLKQGKIL